MTDQEHIERLEKVLRLGQEMRKAQTQYFRHRTEDLLLRSKELERLFDFECVEALDEPSIPGLRPEP
jgi:hypothetical protein